MQSLVIVGSSFIFFIDTLCIEEGAYYGEIPNLGKCFISYQEVLRSVLKKVNH